MTFGERLRQTRKNKGYTQKELASIIGIAKSTLTGYEKDNREPDVIKIKKLAEALDVSAGYLLGVDCCPAILVTKVELTNEEHQIIKKYRSLDESSRKQGTVGNKEGYVRRENNA